jgi:hypothetical protein
MTDDSSVRGIADGRVVELSDIRSPGGFELLRFAPDRPLSSVPFGKTKRKAVAAGIFGGENRKKMKRDFGCNSRIDGHD